MRIELPRDVHWLRSALLAQVPGLKHGFSTRLPAAPGADPPAPPEARGVEQVHDTRILVLEDAAARDRGAGCDGLATARSGACLAVRTADCVPLLLAEREGRAAAALHAGWRGTVAGMAGAGVGLLRERFGIAPEGLVVALGPAIAPCCYEVGVDVARQLADRYGREVVRRDLGPRPHVDLLAANRLGLIRAGVAPEAIETLGLCTACRDDLFPSYRRDGRAAGRLWSYIRLDRPGAG